MPALVRDGIAGEHALLIAETKRGADLSWASKNGLSIERIKQYKTNQHVFFRRAAELSS